MSAEEQVTAVRKPKWAHRWPEETVHIGRGARSNVYVGGRLVGFIESHVSAPTQKVSRGISKDLKPRRVWLANGTGISRNKRYEAIVDLLWPL